MRIITLIALLTIASAGAAWAADLPAFPGAEGFGRFAKGGRGGKAYAVTNLNDGGPGSLREALEAAEPRIVVFRLSGIIALRGPLRVRSFCTIAGQTAPGDGICIKNYPLIVEHASDVIIRYIRCRLGDEGRSGDSDAVSFTHAINCIVDHCSLSWSEDAVFDLTKNTGMVTVQWCILSEALFQSHHSKGGHSMAAGFDGRGGGGSYHHNLLAHCNSRMPRIDAFTDERGAGPLIDFRNNVIYNWGRMSAYGGEHARMNWVSNYYKYGPATRPSIRSTIFSVSSPQSRMYLAGNYVDGFPEVTVANARGIVYQKVANQGTFLAEKPFAVAPVTSQSAEEAFEQVLKEAGASLCRDAVDARIVEEVRTRTARFGGVLGAGSGIIDSQKTVGRWPELKSTPPPADTDQDGIPDWWEMKHGLAPNDPSDANKDLNGDGYTNIEKYINGIVLGRRAPSAAGSPARE